MGLYRVNDTPTNNRLHSRGPYRVLRKCAKLICNSQQVICCLHHPVLDIFALLLCPLSVDKKPFISPRMQESDDNH